MSSPSRGVVAAGHPATAEAGARILRAGGNAFDAAIAALLTACVAEPLLTSLGGGGFLLARTAAGDTALFDFFAHTPRRKRPAAELDFYPVEVQFQDAVQEFHVGLGSMAVPGVWAGVCRVSERLGRLPLAAVAEPAIACAREGTELNDFQHFVVRLLDPILRASPGAWQLYAPAGQLPQPGDRWRMPELADALEFLVGAGPAGFYGGDLAAAIARDCADRGGHLTREDLAAYRVVERSPLAASYRGRALLTNPPPSSGGTLIAFALNLLERCDRADLAPDSPRRSALLAATMRRVNRARQDGYDRHLYDPDVADRFLAPAHLDPYAADLAAIARQLAREPNKLGSTTHISVLDAEGNAASLTTSNGEGSAYVVPGTGIMVNNMLGEADLNPQGFHRWPEDRRLSSMMAPTLVLDGAGDPALVLGSGGSNRIRTAILQAIVAVLDGGVPLDRAVDAPRLHWEAGKLDAEPGLAIAEPTLQDGERLVRWRERSLFFGGVHGVERRADGTLLGAGDPRRSGAVAIA